MLEKRIWPNLLYVLLCLLICVTIYHISSTPEEISNTTVYTLYTSNASSYIYPLHSLPFDDYHHLINISNFTFTILNSSCNDSAPLLLIMVHSSPKNKRRRDTIRETWGQNTNQVRVLFIIGLTNDKETSKMVSRENEKHADLIQGSFLDVYRNITYKHAMVFKYVIYHCPQAKYILKSDDDVFVNMPLMLNFLNFDLSPFGGSKMLFCTIRRRSQVLRSWRSKWRVSFKEYPNRTYPPYCPGWAVLYSPDVVFRLYKEAQRSDYFWIDDVHITGTLVKKLGLEHSDVQSLVMPLRYVGRLVSFSKAFLYGPPDLEEDQIKLLWEYVKSRERETQVSIIKEIKNL